MNIQVREPAVAGRFYPSNPSQLMAEIRAYRAQPTADEEKLQALGCVVPHAGYVYSGGVAAAVYDRLVLPHRYVILCPNHTGHGHPLAILSQGEWRTPLGNVAVDAEAAEMLMGQFPLLIDDADAHREEHALEVQLPFLQAIAKDFRFVPIAVGTSDFDALTALGEAIGEMVERLGERVLIVASSDMNHYEDDDTTRTKDRAAIDRVLALDAAGLFHVIRQMRITMCGFGPTIAMLTAARRLGARQAELIRYATSAEVSGDKSHVVGYAGIAVL